MLTRPITAILIRRSCLRDAAGKRNLRVLRNIFRSAGLLSRDCRIRILLLRFSMTADKFISDEIYRARTWHVRGVGDTHASLRRFGRSCATPKLIRQFCTRVRSRDAALDHRLAYSGEPRRRSSPAARVLVTIGKEESYPREAREVASCRMYLFAQREQRSCAIFNIRRELLREARNINVFPRDGK